MKEQSSSNRGRIFIIDDDQDALLGMKQVLEEEGYDVAGSISPLTASFEMRRFKPDVILLDLNMPALGGERLLSLDRKRTFPAGSQVILCSGSGYEELAAVAKRTGVDGFHCKGDDFDSFLRRIHRWVRCGRARNEYFERSA